MKSGKLIAHGMQGCDYVEVYHINYDAGVEIVTMVNGEVKK